MILRQMSPGVDVQELCTVGGSQYEYYDARTGMYKVFDRDTLFAKMMKQVKSPIVVASLTTRQTEEIRFLQEKGFQAVNEPRRNPNSGNRIILFVKEMDGGGVLKKAAAKKRALKKVKKVSVVRRKARKSK